MKAEIVFSSLLCFILSFLFLANSYGQSGILHEYSFMHDGIERNYLLYVPADYDGLEEWPLVLNFHGFNLTPAQQVAFSQMNSAADDAHFLVAYPAGLIVNNPFLNQPGPGWNLINGTLSDNDDIDFSRQVVEYISADYQIDPYRIHAAGFSMGANMAYEMACLAPDLIASVAAVGAGMDQTIIDRCERDKPVALLQIHGTADPIVPFGGAEGEGFIFPPAPETAVFWANQNDCESEPESEDLPDNDTSDNSTVTRLEYQDCNDDTEVLFYQINNGGHTWPGGGDFPEFLGPVNRDLDANAEILDFFQRNPHPDLTDGGSGKLHKYSFMHDGIERSYWLYAPADYDGQEDWPLVMVFHGFQIDGRFQMKVSQMNPVADRENFLIAYPEGLPVLYPFTGESGPGWIIPGAFEREEHQDDVGFVSKVIDDVNDNYQIDLARVHSTGWSNGSLFSFYLACELSDRIASVGGAGGHMTYAQQSSCNATRPVSTILIHGTDDILVPYDGIPNLFPPAPSTPELWASRNNCSPEPIITELPDIDTNDNSTITRYRYTNCDGKTEMDFYVMNDGGHTWPMGGWPESEVWGNVWPAFLGPVNQDINASEVIWEFFANHPMPTLTIKKFTLVNARNNQDIIELKDGDVLDLSRLPSQLNVRADVMGYPESVQFALNDDEIQPQNAAPYALFSDRDGDYKPGKFAEGNYTLSATPYTGKTATGIVGTPLSIGFEVVRRSTLAEIVRSSEEFSILATALRQVGYLSTVSSTGPFTVFAPNNAAFEVLLTSLNLQDVRQIPIPMLRDVIRYHIVVGQELLAADLSDGQKVKTRQYSDVMISIMDGTVKVNDATVIAPDVLASNGVAHVIDRVLLPPVMDAMSTSGMYMAASPNPGASEVSIEVLNRPNQRVEVAIMNQYGWPVSSKSFHIANEQKANFSVDVSSLPTGVYMIHAQLGNERQMLRVAK